MRSPASLLIAASTALVLFSLGGCGYHTLGAATHLPPNIKTLAVPVFATHTEVSGTEQALTEAVIREFRSVNREVLIGVGLEPPDRVGLELTFNTRPRDARLGEGPRVNDSRFGELV